MRGYFVHCNKFNCSLVDNSHWLSRLNSICVWNWFLVQSSGLTRFSPIRYLNRVSYFAILELYTSTGHLMPVQIFYIYYNMITSARWAVDIQKEKTDEFFRYRSAPSKWRGVQRFLQFQRNWTLWRNMLNAKIVDNYKIYIFYLIILNIGNPKISELNA